MAAPSTSMNMTFNPYDQTFSLLGPDGVTPNMIALADIQELQHIASTSTLIDGIQIGISAMLLLVLLLMTQPEKRRSLVFLLNIVASVLIFVRGILATLVVMSPIYSFYDWEMQYYPENYSNQPSTYISMAAEVLSFLIVVAIEVSMLVQTRTVVKMHNFAFRAVVLTCCYAVASITIAIRFAAMVINASWSILDPANLTSAHFTIIAKFGHAFNGSIIGSIIFFSAIFCIKLGQAIVKRRSLGLKRFGPLQVIFVMGCQTLLIPVIFGIVSYWVLDGSQLYTMMLCIVAAFLPLSSIWASTKTEGNNNIAAPNQWHQRGKGGRFNNSEKTLLSSTANTASSLDDISSSSKGRNHSGATRDSLDLELAKLGHHIQVDHTYSVRSE